MTEVVVRSYCWGFVVKTSQKGTGMEYLFDTGWVDRPEVTAAALQGEIRCDVAVIGAGVGGMAAGLRLAERGVDVVVLEAGICGWGASSRNGGYLTDALSGDPRMLSALHKRRLPGVMRFGQSALRFAEDLIERHQIECDYNRVGWVSMASTTRHRAKNAERAAEVLRSLGADAEYVDGREFGLPHAFLGGVYEPHGGLCNAGKYALGLRKVLLASGARVYEQTPVQDLESSGSAVVITVPGGKVRADRVLLATNGYSADLPFAPPRLAAPLWVSLLETEPIDPERLDSTGWTNGAGFVSNNNIVSNFRKTPHNTIVFGTRNVQAPQGPLGARTTDPAVAKDLLRGFREAFPSLRDVATQKTWGGWIGMSPTLLPVAGQSSSRVLYTNGCNGYGMTQAPYLATLLADRLAGDEMHEDLRAVWYDHNVFPPNPQFSALGARALWTLDRITDQVDRLRS